MFYDWLETVDNPRLTPLKVCQKGHALRCLRKGWVTVTGHSDPPAWDFPGYSIVERRSQKYVLFWETRFSRKRFDIWNGTFYEKTLILRNSVCEPHIVMQWDFWAWSLHDTFFEINCETDFWNDSRHDFREKDEKEILHEICDKNENEMRYDGFGLWKFVGIELRDGNAAEADP